MPYCIYLRKSRVDIEAEMHGEGDTLARHEKALLSLAKRSRLDIIKIHREIVSGETIAARPVMQELLQEVEQGLWQGVLVMEVERLARGDTIDQGIVAQTFKYSDTKIITPTKTYDPSNEFDEEYFEFGLFMSRREYKTINRRLQRGRMASVMEGKYVSSRAPFGYDRVKLMGEKGYTLAPNDEAEIVKLIFNLYTVGELSEDGTYRRLGIYLISRHLNDMGVRAPNNGKWSTYTIRDILANPIYIGKIRWNHKPTQKKMVNGKVVEYRPRIDESDERYILVDGRHPAIIDENTFNKAQEYTVLNRRNTVPKGRTIKNPLSGIIVCAKCGRSMVRRPYNNGYHDTLICSNVYCDNISCTLSVAEQRVLEALEEWLNDYRLKWESNSLEDNVVTPTTKEESLKLLEKEYTNLQSQLENIHDLLERGIYTTDLFLQRSQLISQKIQSNIDNRTVLLDEIEKDKAREESRQVIIPKVEYLLATYNNLPNPKAKNDMLKEVLEKVVYLKTKNGRWHNSPDDFEITIYPKIPSSTDS